MDDWIVESDVARLLGISYPSMRERRRRGNVPPYRRCECGHAILYRRSDVEQLRKGQPYQARAS